MPKAIGAQSDANKSFDKVQQGVADSGIGGPLTKIFHTIGGTGEKLVSKTVGGGPEGDFVGQTFFDPIGAGLTALGGFNGRQRDVADVDPNQAARLREIDRTRKMISQGTDPLTQMRVSEARKAGETTKGQLAKVGGGDVGGTISSFLRAQRNTGKSVNQAFSQGQARIPFFENLSTQLGNRISQRKLELGIHRADQDAAEAAQAQTVENLNREASSVSSDTGQFGGLADYIKDKTGGDSTISGGGIGGGLSEKFPGVIGNGSDEAGGGGLFGKILGGGENGGGLQSILGGSGGGGGEGKGLGGFQNILGGGGEGKGFGGMLNSGKEAGGSGLLSKAGGLFKNIF